MSRNELLRRLLAASALDRRALLKYAAASAAMPALSACSRGSDAGRVVKIGMVAPLTGPLAAFAEPDPYVLDLVRKQWANGIMIGGAMHQVEIIEKDSQSSTSRAAEVAEELILQDKIDLMVTGNTADTVNPVADQCEANEIPCISTDAPWEPFYFGRGATPQKGFDWTFHFFWGFGDIFRVFMDLWNSLSTNKVVAAMWENTTEGNAAGDATTGFPPVLAANGFKVIDPGRYPFGAQDFSAQITRFKNEGCEIMHGVMSPPDFNTFWNQCAQLDFHPKVVSVGKALLFPSAIEALGPRGNGLSSEVWWTPNHPFTSSFIPGFKPSDLASGYTASSGKQWTQPLGFKFALFEVANDVLARAASLARADIASAIRTTNCQTLVGPVRWSGNEIANVSKTPLAGGQWRPGAQFPYDLVVVNNMRAPEIPLQGMMEPLTI